MKKLIAFLLIISTFLALLTGCDLSEVLNKNTEPDHVPPSPNPEDTDEKKEDVYIEVESLDTTHGAPRIYVIWHNGSENMLTTATHYSIEYKNGDEWETLTPSEDAYFSQFAFTVAEESEKKVAYRIDFFDTSRKGTYRIRVGYAENAVNGSVGYSHLYAEFDPDALPDYEGHTIKVKGEEYLYDPLPERLLDGKSVQVKVELKDSKTAYFLMVDGVAKEFTRSSDGRFGFYVFMMPDYDVTVEIRTFELTGLFSGEEELIRTYLCQNPKVEWVKIKNYYDTLPDGAVVVMLEDSDDSFEEKRWEEDVRGWNFRYSDENRITVFKKGEFMTLTEYGKSSNSNYLNTTEALHKELYASLYNDNFKWQMVRLAIKNGNGLDKLSRTSIIRSVDELKQYCEKHKDTLYLGQDVVEISSASTTFMQATAKYDDEYFKTNILVLVIKSGSSTLHSMFRVKSVRNEIVSGEKMLAVKLRMGSYEGAASADISYACFIIEVDKSMEVVDDNHIVLE